MPETNSKPPSNLYRGITIPSSEFQPSFLTGDLTPGSRVEQPNGVLTVSDGNEYGVYMSTNEDMVKRAYADPRHGKQIPGFEKLSYGYSRDVIQEPSIGIMYKVDSSDLQVRKPRITRSLQGVYNNGFIGDEWIADIVPASHISIPYIKLGRDALHGELVIEPEDGDVRPHAERLQVEAAERVERLKQFGLAVLELTPAQRMNPSRVERIIEQIKTKQ